MPALAASTLSPATRLSPRHEITVSRRLDRAAHVGHTERADSERALFDQALAYLAECHRLLGQVTTVSAMPEALFPAIGHTAPSRPPARQFRLEGDYWTIAYDGHAFRLRDSKGLRTLAALLAHPGREHHALDLACAAEGAGERHGITARDLDGLSVEPVVDEKARTAYRRRIEELRCERDQADAAGDPAGADAASAEIDALVAQLSAAYGLAGRVRSVSTPTERARISVTKTVKAAIDRIADHSPALAFHLRATVRTGTYSSFTPDPAAPVGWAL